MIILIKGMLPELDYFIERMAEGMVPGAWQAGHGNIVNKKNG